MAWPLFCKLPANSGTLAGGAHVVVVMAPGVH